MASSGYWIDPDELAQLGAELNGDYVDEQFHPEQETLLDLFGDPIEEVGEREISKESQDLNIERLGEQLAAIKKRAEDSGLLRSSELEVKDESKCFKQGVLSAEETTLVERLESFVEWAYGQDSLTGLFITDIAGKELVESGADPVIVASGIAVAEGWQGARGILKDTVTTGVSTAASVRDWEGAVLTVFSCRSAYGQHVLGALSTQPLRSRLSSGLRMGFGRVMGVV